MSRSYSTLAGFGAERPQIVTGAADNDDSLPGCPMCDVVAMQCAAYVPGAQAGQTLAQLGSERPQVLASEEPTERLLREETPGWP